MATDSSVPSSGDAGARSSSAQPSAVEQRRLNSPRQRLSDNNSETEQGDDQKPANGSRDDGVGEKPVLEHPVEVDADLENEDDPEISEIPPEVRRVVSLHDDSTSSSFGLEFIIALHACPLVVPDRRQQRLCPQSPSGTSCWPYSSSSRAPSYPRSTRSGRRMPLTRCSSSRSRLTTRDCGLRASCLTAGSASR
ncbi:putative oligopeptide transporter OPT superfamily [Rosellinia necatrix]|uniref:Putative oligopeptide transporter OPT superfamily n=1 Tax=Rosellinia necatrix TaxID=77044 RepID=A0A1S8A6H7_ROSNE|nr:putative oligopeptide transporter OPT superfamily [Rosellinia necatrix]